MRNPSTPESTAVGAAVRVSPEPALERDLLAFAVARSSSVLYVAEHGGDGPLAYISDNVEAVTGHSRDAFLTVPGYGRAHIHPDDLPAYVEGVASLVERDVLAMEYRLRAPGGEYRWYRDEVRRVTGTTGRAQVVGCMLDVTEERETRERLRASEAECGRLARLLADAVENLPGGFAVSDADDRITLCNAAFSALYGLPPERMVGTSLVENVRRMRARVRLFDGEPVAGTQAGLERMVGRLGAVGSAPVEIGLDDGSWVLVSRHRTSSGSIVTLRTDVTAMKRVEQALRESEARLRTIIDNSPVCIHELDPAGRITSMNPSGLAMAQIASEREIRGRYYLDMAAPIERERVEGLFASALAGEQVEFEFVAEDDRHYYAAKIPVKDETGAVTRLIGITMDITERKRVEQALRESEALVRRVLDASPVPIGMSRVDDGTIIYESPASQALFARDPTAGRVSARDYFVVASDRDRYVARLRATGAVDGFEVRLRNGAGEEFWAMLSARLLDFQGEEVIVSTTIDLTERHAVETELARQRDLLHKSEKLSAMGELLAGVSHELNNPLSVVVGQALLLGETATDPAIGVRAERIGAAADRCARIVRTFLSMARQRPVESVPVALNRVVESTMEVIGYALRASDIQVRLTLDEALPAVRADAGQITQVLTNLMVNAQHALQEIDGPRRLEIATSLDAGGKGVMLAVRDNGPGIPDEDRRRVFDPFFTSKAAGLGTGLGLAVCQRIVESHGGSIALVDGDGPGCSFEVRLPAWDAPAPIDAGESVGPEETARLSVLVIDDERDVAEVVADILETDGHGVVIAGSGREALALVESRPFDVVLSDLRMPDLDGPALHRRLARSHPELVARLAFLTGDTMSPQIRRFLTESGRPCLEKPSTPAELRAFVREIAG